MHNIPYFSPNRHLKNPDMYGKYGASPNLGKSIHLPNPNVPKGSTFMALVGRLHANRKPEGKQFQFEASWLLERDCEEFIRNFWSSNIEALPQKLECLGKALMSWGSSKRLERRKAKSYLETRLHTMEVNDLDDENVAEIIDVRLALRLEANKEERKKTNTITEIVDQTGSVVSSIEEILAVASTYFSDMFIASTLGDTAGIFNNVRRHIPPDLNSALLAPFTGEEVYVVLRTMFPLKAPGLDGFPALFYQQYWYIVGK
ncbi:hypothetical protein V6N12_044441 [Hibiscus sabdariffa]|uniref:BTB domain-containing protein n=1 Tax=Hibiscus sabdariffa TaxID=183260 RepID=A0ABR2BNE9_9ROSI